MAGSGEVSADAKELLVGAPAVGDCILLKLVDSLRELLPLKLMLIDQLLVLVSQILRFFPQPYVVGSFILEVVLHLLDLYSELLSFDVSLLQVFLKLAD